MPLLTFAFREETMLKLLIADDEKVIRDSISSFIDWKKLNIHLIGSARDGIEAYNMILDNYPELVLTDIRMPGLSGLDLIRRIKEINKDTQFIILSGFGEFEYAKQAMQYGVRHYLLKPTNEAQIEEAVSEAAREYEQIRVNRLTGEQSTGIIRNLYRAIINNLVNRYLSADQKELNEHEDDFYREYRRSIGSTDIPYAVHVLSPVSESMLDTTIRSVSDFFQNSHPETVSNCFFGESTLIISHPDNPSITAELHSFLQKRNLSSGRVTHYKNIPEAFHEMMMNQIGSFRTIQYYDSDSYEFVTIKNAGYTGRDTLLLAKSLFSSNVSEADHAFHNLTDRINDCDSFEAVRQIIMTVIVTACSHTADPQIAEDLLHAQSLSQIRTLASLKNEAIAALHELYARERHELNQKRRSVSDKIRYYVENNLSDSRISLKWIAEQVLFLNVDYLSRKFLKETNERFSTYLTRVRVERAEQLIKADPGLSVASIAEQVGCGNNPQYFSQIFKKLTGLTPLNYARICASNPEPECVPLRPSEAKPNPQELK